MEVKLDCPLGLFCSHRLPAVTVSSGRASCALASPERPNPKKLKELLLTQMEQPREGLGLAVTCDRGHKVCRRAAGQGALSLKCETLPQHSLVRSPTAPSTPTGCSGTTEGGRKKGWISTNATVTGKGTAVFKATQGRVQVGSGAWCSWLASTCVCQPPGSTFFRPAESVG